MTDICRQCRLKTGFKPRDNGAHTAVIKPCDICGEEKPILPEYHWQKTGMVTWVVYKNPVGYPGQYVARRFVQDERTQYEYIHDELLEVREWIQREAARLDDWAPFYMDRHTSDELTICEVWM